MGESQAVTPAPEDDIACSDTGPDTHVESQSEKQLEIKEEPKDDINAISTIGCSEDTVESPILKIKKSEIPQESTLKPPDLGEIAEQASEEMLTDVNQSNKPEEVIREPEPPADPPAEDTVEANAATTTTTTTTEELSLPENLHLPLNLLLKTENEDENDDSDDKDMVSGIIVKNNVGSTELGTGYDNTETVTTTSYMQEPSHDGAEDPKANEESQHTQPYTNYSDIIYVPDTSKKKKKHMKSAAKKRKRTGDAGSESDRVLRKRHSHTGVTCNNSNPRKQNLSRLYYCKECNQGKIVRINYHMNQNHNIWLGKDIVVYKDEEMLVYAYKYNSEDDYVQCLLCDIPFSSIRELTQHMNSGIHPSETVKKVCPKCNKIILTSPRGDFHEDHVKLCNCSNKKPKKPKKSEISKVKSEPKATTHTSTPAEVANPTNTTESQLVPSGVGAIDNGVSLNTIRFKLEEFASELKTLPRGVPIRNFSEDLLKMSEYRRILQTYVKGGEIPSFLIADELAFAKDIFQMASKYSSQATNIPEIEELISLSIRYFRATSKKNILSAISEGITDYLFTTMKTKDRDMGTLNRNILKEIDDLGDTSDLRSYFLVQLCLGLLEDLKGIMGDLGKFDVITDTIDNINTRLLIAGKIESLGYCEEWNVVLGYSIRICGSFPLISDRILNLFSQSSATA